MWSFCLSFILQGYNLLKNVANIGPRNRERTGFIILALNQVVSNVVIRLPSYINLLFPF